MFSCVENISGVCLSISSSSDPKCTLAGLSQLVRAIQNGPWFLIHVSNSHLGCNPCRSSIVPPFTPLCPCMFRCAAVVLHPCWPWRPWLPSCIEVHQYMHLVPTLVSTEINQNFACAFSKSRIWLCSETIRSTLESPVEGPYMEVIGK